MEKRMLVEGMKCMHCKAGVEQALKAVEGVTEAEADLETKAVRIAMEKDVADGLLMEAVRQKGFKPVQMI